MLAHAKRLRVIAESNHKRDEMDAELLARTRLADLIPYVHKKDIETREQATLTRHRARLVASARVPSAASTPSCTASVSTAAVVE